MILRRLYSRIERLKREQNCEMRGETINGNSAAGAQKNGVPSFSCRPARAARVLLSLAWKQPIWIGMYVFGFPNS